MSYGSFSQSKPKASLLAMAIALIVVLLAVVALFNLVPFLFVFYRSVVAMLLTGLVWIVPLLLFAVLGFVAMYAAENGREGPKFIAGSVAAVLLVTSVIAMVGSSYWNHRALYNASDVTHENTASSVSLSERVPYDVASSVAHRSMGNTTGDLVGALRTVPSTGQYDSLVKRRGILVGYEAAQEMRLPLYGTFNFERDVKFCDFDRDKAAKRFGGALGNNLEAAVYSKFAFWNPTFHVSEDDALVVCQDAKTPIMYMPATKMAFNGLVSYRVPAGVVTYNGSNGDLAFSETMEINGTPLYPTSLAKDQREALTTADGFWSRVLNKAGYDTTNKDGDDPNASNPSEFSVFDVTSKRAQYVTPLLPRGSSTSVVALSQIDSQSVTAGKLNRLTVNAYDNPRQATSTEAKSIISDQLSGYKATGLTVFEVVPSLSGNWTASIGNNQSIKYRAVINSDGKATLTDEKGSKLTAAPDEAGKKSADSIDLGKPLSSMSPDELKAAMNKITDELAKRANSND